MNDLIKEFLLDIEAVRKTATNSPEIITALDELKTELLAYQKTNLSDPLIAWNQTNPIFRTMTKLRKVGITNNHKWAFELSSKYVDEIIKTLSNQLYKPICNGKAQNSRFNS